MDSHGKILARVRIFKRFKPRNRLQGMNSASLCSLAGRYDNSIPPRFLAPIGCLKIPALNSVFSSGAERHYQVAEFLLHTVSVKECALNTLINSAEYAKTRR
jgi:hypothetical protein